MNKEIDVINDIIHSNNIDITNLNEVNNDILLKRYDDLIKNEPSKIFKNKHKKWEKEINNLKKKLDNSFDYLYENYQNIEKTIK